MSARQNYHRGPAVTDELRALQNRCASIEDEHDRFLCRLPLALVRTDADLRVVEWNPAAEFTFGYARAEALGRNALDLIVPDPSIAFVADAVRRLRAGDMEMHVTSENKTKAGKTIICDWTNTPLLDDAGAYTGNVGLARDITEEVRSRELVREREAQIRLLLDSTGEAIYGLDTEGNCTFCNAACLTALGYERVEDLLGRHMPAVTRHSYPDGTPMPKEECRIYNALCSGEETHGDGEVFWRKDGSSFPAECWVRLLRGHDRAIKGAVVTFVDITERRALERELARHHERFATIFDNAPVMIKFLDAEGHLVLFNRACSEVMGWSPAQAYAHDFLDRVYPEAAERERILAFIREAPPGWHDFQTRTQDGRVLDLSWAVVALSDQTRVIIGIDVTELNRTTAELARKRSALQTIVDNVPVLLEFYDRDGLPTLVNRHWGETLGYELEEVTSWQLISPRYPEPDPEFGRRIADLITAADGTWHDAPARVRDGRVLDISWAVVRTSDGRRVAIGVDVTEKRRTEAELARQRAVLQAIFDNVPVFLQFYDAGGRPTLVNRHWRETLGYAVEDITTWDLFSPRYPEPDPEYHLRIAGQIEKADGTWLDSRVRVRDGRVQDHSWAVVRTPDGSRIAFGIDVTERKHLEAEREQAGVRLQALSRRVVEVQESERRHLARELHDEIGQTMSAVALNLHTVRREWPLAAHERLDLCIGIVDDMIDRVRGLALDLRPAVLDVLGLPATLRWLLDRVAAPADLTAHVSLRLSDTELPSDLTTACFRVAQETLNNVVKHAKATNVWLEMWQDDGTSVGISVRDDGVGFDTAEAASRGERGESLGLLGVEERIELFGGTLEITSSPGQGTSVRVWFPVTAQSGIKDE